MDFISQRLEVRAVLGSVGCYGIKMGSGGQKKGSGGWVLVNIYARKLTGLEDKLICGVRLVLDIIRGG